MNCPWLSYKQFGNLVGNLTGQNHRRGCTGLAAGHRHEIWQNKQPDDYSGGPNTPVKRDFLRSWNHDRKYKSVSLEELGENGVRLDDSIRHPRPARGFKRQFYQGKGSNNSKAACPTPTGRSCSCAWTVFAAGNCGQAGLQNRRRRFQTSGKAGRAVRGSGQPENTTII